VRFCSSAPHSAQRETVRVPGMLMGRGPKVFSLLGAAVGFSNSFFGPPPESWYPRCRYLRSDKKCLLKTARCLVPAVGSTRRVPLCLPQRVECALIVRFWRARHKRFFHDMSATLMRKASSNSGLQVRARWIVNHISECYHRIDSLRDIEEVVYGGS
jgi:hypothetical protein